MEGLRKDCYCPIFRVEVKELTSFFHLQIFRITGGNDKQGFPMKQGVVCNHTTRQVGEAPILRLLLLDASNSS